MLVWGTRGFEGAGRAHSAEYVVVVGEVCLAVLAPVYARGVQVDVVRKAHVDGCIENFARCMRLRRYVVGCLVSKRGSWRGVCAIAGLVTECNG
jgi:hypothetical protein